MSPEETSFIGNAGIHPQPAILDAPTKHGTDEAYPFLTGLTLQQVTRLYWRIKKVQVQISNDWSVDDPPMGKPASGTASIDHTFDVDDLKAPAVRAKQCYFSSDAADYALLSATANPDSDVLTIRFFWHAGQGTGRDLSHIIRDGEFFYPSLWLFWLYSGTDQTGGAVIGTTGNSNDITGTFTAAESGFTTIADTFDINVAAGASYGTNPTYSNHSCAITVTEWWT